ncbi:MAG: glycosyltransferase family 4 protein [Gammaproteobacteria bacterium]|nr:glycosyltransferase family 4 protein [Gammaproteobacteria bacterium]NNM12815.1 glycosyltransferase family 4 protein [Gammaproteobacteria bacterium]
MKVLHIETGRQLAGGPLQVITLMKGMRENGQESMLLCPQDSAIARVAKQAELPVTTVAYQGEHDVSLVRAIRRTARSEGVEILHAHSRRGADLYTAFVARRTRIPAILTRRVINMENALIGGIKYRSYQRVVAVSEAVERSLKRQRVDASLRTVIHDGVDFSDFDKPYPRQKYLEEFGLPENAVIAANVGRFTENKSQLSVLQAFTLIYEALPRLHLVLFGSGEMQDDLEDFVIANKLEGRVHFAGFRNDMPNWYAAMDMLVHTASLEALSVSLLEASANAVPMIAYNNGGIYEIIRHTFNGLLVQPRAVDQLAHAIERLYRKPDMRKKMGATAKDYCEKFFTAEQLVSKYQELYTQVLSELE